MRKLNTIPTETQWSWRWRTWMNVNSLSPGGSYTSPHSTLGFLKCDITRRWAASLHPSERSSFTGFWSESLQFAAAQDLIQVSVMSSFIIFGPSHSPSMCFFPSRPCLPLLVLAVAVAFTWRCGSRGWHIDTAAQWTPACSRSDSWTLAPDRPAGTRISEGTQTLVKVSFFIFQDALSAEIKLYSKNL